MPDIFIPEDTTLYTSYYKEALYSMLIGQFALTFTEANRQKLNTLKTLDAMEGWLRKQNILEQFASFADEHGLRRRNLMLRRSAPLFERSLFATIIYDAWDQNMRIQFLSKDDPAVLKAVELLKEGASVPTLEN